MKKFGFFALLVATMLTMTSCPKPGPDNPDDPQSGVKSLTLSMTEKTMVPGESVSITATVDPTNTTITWTTDNADVATVGAKGKKVMIQAVGDGVATITAKAGDKTAICKITVDANAMYDRFNMAGYGLFGSEFEFVAGTDTTIELSDGSMVNAQKAGIHWYGWDGDLSFVNGTGWVGQGEVIDGGQVYVYVIKGGQYDGYYIGTPEWVCYPTTEEYPVYCINPGYINPETYGDWVSYLYEDTTHHQAVVGDPDQDIIWAENGGCLIASWDTSDEDYGCNLNFGLYDAKINKFIFVDEDEEEGTEAMFAADLDWFNMTDSNRIYGFAVDYEKFLEHAQQGVRYIEFIRPYDFATVHKVFDVNDLFTQYENPVDQVRARNQKKVYTLGDQSKLHIGQPAPVSANGKKTKGGKSTTQVYKK